jgi:hypothetical protein
MDYSNSNSNLNDTAEGRFTSHAHDGGVIRVNPSDLAPGGSGILATAVHPQSGNLTTRLTDETIVQHGGIQMALREAERLGFVTRDAQGNYSERDAGADTARAQEQQEGAPSDAPMPFDSEAEAFATQFASQVAPEFQQAAFEQVLANGMDKLDLQPAALSGMSEAAYRAGIETIRANLQGQADTAIQAQGVDPQAFYAWAWAKQPDALKDAARRHFNGRNPNAYAALVKDYVHATQPSSGALNRAGYETRIERGVEIVRIGDTWTTVTAAARAGLI